MTTNLNAIAGPSKQMSPASTISVSVSPKPEPESPEFIGDLSGLTAAATGHDMSASGSGSGSAGAVNKSGLSVDENGEVVKVPAFLQKLFSMVSDPGTDTLIYWAESGDSFFVPNHERFGKEILPRFFKHSNFSSFVRQLNMYGFHKVPQPQTGVLKADNPNESELWEFVNPFFKRGKAHLLSRVMRKNNRPGNPPPTAPAPNPNATRSSSRQASNTASSANATGLLSSTGQYLITDGTTEGEAGIMVGPSGQQMIDLSAITNGIAAIQRTQASIGADLKALQSSNELLWREAAVQREKNQKHQETIDLIVTFLERLFGTEGEGLKGLKEAMRRGGLGSKREDTGDDNTGSSKKRKRLGIDRMISDGREEHVGEDGQIVEISESPNSVDPFNLSLPRYRSSQAQRSDQLSSSDPWSSTSQRFTNLPSEEEGSPFNPASSSSASTRLPTPNTNNANQLFSPLSDSANNLPAIDPSALVPYFQQQQQSAGQRANNQDGPSSNQPLSPGSTAAAASAFNLDPSILQTTIGSLLQSPAAAQMFLNSLNNSAQGQALQTPSKLNPNQAQPQAGLGQGGSGFPFNGPVRNGNGFDTNAQDDGLDPTLALFSPLRHQNALLQNDEALMKSYQEAVGINGDVEKLQDSIDSLVRSMGLDLPDSTNQSSTSDLNANTGGDNGLGGLDSEFNVDDFLEHLAQDDK